jgi:hypothetical protein
MLRAMVFTVKYLGFEPRIASERKDTGEVRLRKIKDLIKASCFSIHDISRMEPLKKSDLPRFNMPFELGLDFGCREYGEKVLKQKRCLVLEKEKYRYQKVLSDISGSDIENHNNEPRELVHRVRGWLQSILQDKVPGATSIWQSFNEFMADLEEAGTNLKLTEEEINEMPIDELMVYLNGWLQNKGILPS